MIVVVLMQAVAHRHMALITNTLHAMRFQLHRKHRQRRRRARVTKSASVSWRSKLFFTAQTNVVRAAHAFVRSTKSKRLAFLGESSRIVITSSKCISHL